MGRAWTRAAPGSAHRLAVEWTNARGGLSEQWDADELAGVAALVETLPPNGGAEVILVHPTPA